MKTLIISILLSTSLHANEIVNTPNTTALTFDQTRWSNLMKLVDSEISTIRNNPYSGAELKHRLFELYSEKIKLIKEKENHNFLLNAQKLNDPNMKDDFFKNSKAQFKTAQAYANGILKQYPNYANKDLLYYAMAINSRDYDLNKDTEKYLLLSLKHKNNKNNENHYNAKVALAEHYYNHKKYSDAITHYNEILKNEKNEWLAKHQYNAAWCFLKVRNFNKALDLMLEAHKTGQKENFISMNDQVLQAAGIFFVQADKTFEAIKFYLNHSTEPTQHLLSLANSSMSKNNFDTTNEVLLSALNDAKKRKNINDEVKVRNSQLNIYKENKKDALFFRTAKDIHQIYKKHKVDDDEIFMAQNKIKEVAGFMQINLIKDKLSKPVKYSTDEYNQIITYFDILTTLDKDKKALYRYYQGETALSTQNYDTALKFYVRSIINSKINNKADEITKKSLDALLSTIEVTKLGKNKKYEYSIFAMKNYIKFYPEDKISQTSFQKLFSIYFDKKDLKKSINTLLVYKKMFKSDIENQRSMLTDLLDYHIKNKHTDALAFWVNIIEKNFLSFDENYIKKSIQILGSLLFEKYQGLEKKGLHAQAVKGYKSIYDNKKYPKTTKGQAAYAISSLSIELNKPKDSFEWINKSFSLFEKEELLKVVKPTLHIALGLRLFQEFDYSTNISMKMINEICFENKDEINEFYRIAHENSLLSNYSIKKIHEVEIKSKSCNVRESNKIVQHENNIMNLIFLDKFDQALEYYKSFTMTNKVQIAMKQYVSSKFLDNPEKIKPIMLSLTNLDFSKELISYSKLQEQILHLNDFKVSFSQKDVFDDELFNSELEQYFSMIQSLDKANFRLSKNFSVPEIIMLRNHEHKPYLKLIEAIEKFSPNGVEKDYEEGFKASMRQITQSLRSKLLQIDNEKRAFLAKNNYFFEIQKNVIFALATNSKLEKELHIHNANLYSNTLDVGVKPSMRKLAGN